MAVLLGGGIKGAKVAYKQIEQLVVVGIEHKGLRKKIKVDGLIVGRKLQVELGNKGAVGRAVVEQLH